MGLIELRRALRFKGAGKAAFVGAGGKTTALFALARQLEGPVLVSTSTHLSVEQSKGADQHIVLEKGATLPQLEASELAPVTLFTGTQVGDERLGAPDDSALTALSAFARAEGLAFLIEADGARQLSLKAPAAHEPAIPDFVDLVVVLAGFSALGKPLSAETAHRPERFAELSGLEMGATIGAQQVAAVLSHPMGGLKNIPEGARRIALLNQVEGERLAGAARGMADKLLPHFDAVLAAALAPDGGGAGGVSAVYEPVAGILLAAGGSGRLGEPKQLLDWRGKSFVRQVAKTGLAAGLSPLVVVTGAFAEQVEAALDGLDVLLVRNEHWESGQSSSVKAGLAALPGRAGAAIFLMVDQPQLPVALLEALMAEHARSLAPIVAPQVDGQRSNPVLFDRDTFKDFAAIEGDVGGRAIFSRHRVSWLPWLDASLAIDVDKPEDYQKLLNHAG